MNTEGSNKAILEDRPRSNKRIIVTSNIADKLVNNNSARTYKNSNKSETSTNNTINSSLSTENIQKPSDIKPSDRSPPPTRKPSDNQSKTLADEPIDESYKKAFIDSKVYEHTDI